MTSWLRLLLTRRYTEPLCTVGTHRTSFLMSLGMTCSRGCITMLHVTPFYHHFNKTESDIDFAHDGQGFLSWHRLYLLAWERTLQEINDDEEFSFLSGTGLRIPLDATPQFALKSCLA